MLRTMLPHLLIPLAAALLPSSALAQFQNTALTRTVELGSATVHATTAYQFTATEDGVREYVVDFTPEERRALSWFEVREKGAKEELGWRWLEKGSESEPLSLSVQLPSALSPSSPLTTLIFTALQTNTTTPLPSHAAQDDPLHLLYTTSSHIPSRYPTAAQRTKIRAPTPKLLSFSTTADAEKTTKSGAVVTYGPWKDVPAGFGSGEEVRVHFEGDRAVAVVKKAERLAEVSHWGAALSVEDWIALHNEGPALKGHFNRLQHQQSSFLRKTSASILSGLTLRLPGTVRNPYYADAIGNVSTSHFRPEGVLELKPRFPILGGWKYEFVVGWDADLGRFGSDLGNGEFVVGVPFLNPLPDVAVDEAVLKVVLPEGAHNIEVHPPFPVDSITHETTYTFLDTTGRPTVVLTKRRASEKHGGTVYIKYALPWYHLLQKPAAVAGAALAFLLLAAALKRVRWTTEGESGVGKKKAE